MCIIQLKAGKTEVKNEIVIKELVQIASLFVDDVFHLAKGKYKLQRPFINSLHMPKFVSPKSADKSKVMVFLKTDSISYTIVLKNRLKNRCHIFRI